MRDTRQSSPIMTLLLAVAAAGLAVSAFFLPDVHECTVSIVQPEWLSNVLSLLTLLAVAVSLNYVNSNNFQFSSDSKLLYLPYLLAVMAFPGAITLTYCHLAAFLTVWTLYFTLMYVNGEYHRLYYAFMAGLVSSLSALLLGLVGKSVIVSLVVLAIGILLLVNGLRAKKMARKIFGIVFLATGLLALLGLSGVPYLEVGIPGILSLYFDVFSGGVQALVFSLLTMVYVGNVCPPPEEA